MEKPIRGVIEESAVVSGRSVEKKLCRHGETFGRRDSSIRVQLVMRLFQKKPRGGSRGAMTRSLSGR